MATFPNELRGDRLWLRRTSLNDVDEALDAVEVSFEALHQWMSWAATMPSRAALVEFTNASDAQFDADEHWSYWVREIDGDLLVGSASLRPNSAHELEIGYWMRSDRTGRGYATESARILTTAAFDTVPLIDTVKISMDRANYASAAVPKKLGFHLDSEYEREAVTPGHSGRGIAWTVERDEWQRRDA